MPKLGFPGWTALGALIAQKSRRCFGEICRSAVRRGRLRIRAHRWVGLSTSKAEASRLFRLPMAKYDVQDRRRGWNRRSHLRQTLFHRRSLIRVRVKLQEALVFQLSVRAIAETVVRSGKLQMNRRESWRSVLERFIEKPKRLFVPSLIQVELTEIIPANRTLPEFNGLFHTGLSKVWL